MTERKFARNLRAGGTAAAIRECVKQDLKERSVLTNKAKLVEPLDYENVLVKNKTILQNDPLRELLLFPYDDVSQSELGRRLRTFQSSVPSNAVNEAEQLLARECIKSYLDKWHVIHFKYSAYSGGFDLLPKISKTGSELPKQIFEIDVELEGKDEDRSQQSKLSSIKKKGWLYKGPDSNHEASIVSFTKSFKKRYFHLKQHPDASYELEFFKDDRRMESKGQIFLDSAVDVQKSARKGKLAFEIMMQNKGFYVLSAETEAELEEWVVLLKKVIQSNDISSPGTQDKIKEKDSRICKNSRIKRDKESFNNYPSNLGLPRGESFRDSLEYSMNPELQKYARETDISLAALRKEGRGQIFSYYNEIQKNIRPDNRISEESTDSADVFKEQFGLRFFVHCTEFRLRLQANIADDGQPERLDNPEPFFITFSLYDAKEGRKLSEDFHVDPNSNEIRAMIPPDMIHPGGSGTTPPVISNGSTSPGLSGGLRTREYIKTAIFSVSKPSSDIFLVARIEKVLQGSVSAALEPYLKTTDVKTGTMKVHRPMRQFCQRLGHYRMPFAWAARPLFRKYSPKELDTTADFVVYKAESSKMCEEEIIKTLQDMKRADKQMRQQPIQGIMLRVTVVPFKSPVQNTVTSSLLPLRASIDDTAQKSPASVQEVEEFVPCEGRVSHPYATYINNLYVQPRNLDGQKIFDSQKMFAKAKNIACSVEIRDSDDDHVKPLAIIYGRPGGPVFTSSALTTVLHHNSSPDFIDEVKVALPINLTERHHVLFKFFHVSCDPANKPTQKKPSAVEPAGFAWLPLLNNGRVDVGEHTIRVAFHLPPSYLKVSPNDVKWVDGGKPLFRLNLGLVSSIYTRDPHLHNFFVHCQKLETLMTSTAAAEFGAIMKLKTSSVASNGSAASNGDNENVGNGVKFDKNREEILNVCKSLHAVDVSSIINFLPPLLTQLFRLLTRTTNEDVAGNAVRVLIHIVTQLHDVDKVNLLRSYVKYVFVTETSDNIRPPQQQPKTVHEELAQQLKAILRPNMADPLVTGKFLNHSWFFFEIIIKSMAQHLLNTERIKMARNERFPASFQFHIGTLVQSLCQHIIQKQREAGTDVCRNPNNVLDCRSANKSLADFIKKCFTFMDRGFVFRLVNSYMENFSPADSKLLHEYKFKFLEIICSHEHYVPLNLPIMRKQVKSYKDLKHDYTLTEEFQQNHFLVGLLLHEVKVTLNEVMDIRKFAIRTLRNLLAKHSFDSRYTSKAAQCRIAALYLPLVMILIENKSRLAPVSSQVGGDQPQVPPSYQGSLASGTESLSGQSSDSLNRSSTLGSYTSQMSLNSDQASLNSGVSGTSLTGSSSRAVRADPNAFSIISGQASAAIALTSMEQQGGSVSHHGSTGSLTSNSANSVTSVSTEKAFDTGSLKDSSICSDARSSVMGTTSVIARYDKLDVQESKDLLLCFLYVVKNLAEEVLLGWLNNCSEVDVIDFFSILEISLQHFKYAGKKRITSLCIISNSNSSRKSLTLPQGGVRKPVASSRTNSLYGGASDSHTDGANHVTQSDADAVYQAMLDANLCVEVSMIVLDTVTLYVNNFKDQLQYSNGENDVMKKVFDLYLMFLQTTQSESVHTHAFATLRSFITKFPTVLFQGEAKVCERLCYEILRCCSSKLDVTRTEACALMYLFMRKNFEFSKGTNFTRVHLQMMVSVSQLISNEVIISGSRFAESLSIISSYASNDKAMQKTNFPVEVKDLMKCIRTVLMSTSQMKEHRNDPEKYIDLLYSLAKSYTSMPEMRKTWLDAMASMHMEKGDYSEAAHCHIHMAALVAEYLKRKGEFPQGCTVFKTISPNAESEESGMREDSGMVDRHYTDNDLILLLEQCARTLEQAERYELLGEIYRFILPIYEGRRDFVRISAAYEILHRAYDKVVEVMRTGKRMLGKYFRVAFFGQQYFEDEDGKEYVYKEPKVTGLQEICDRLSKLYSMKFGAGNLKLIMDSNKVDCQKLDPKLAYIQVTYVTPYFEERELTERQTDFEKNNNIRRFMFETPFTTNGKAHGEIDQQHKRRTILTTSHSFPYVKKRILVVYHKEEILTPIEVAIDEIKNKVAELTEVVCRDDTDLKKLQLKLQGSVSVQVHAGPLAYANAFLEASKVNQYKREHVETLKEHFRSFVTVCGEALGINARLISDDQRDYHESLRHNFVCMVEKLGKIFNETLLDDEDRQSIASVGSSSNRNSLVISGITYATQSVNV